jgi:hypothetical protein
LTFSLEFLLNDDNRIMLNEDYSFPARIKRSELIFLRFASRLCVLLFSKPSRKHSSFPQVLVVMQFFKADSQTLYYYSKLKCTDATNTALTSVGIATSSSF